MSASTIQALLRGKVQTKLVGVIECCRRFATSYDLLIINILCGTLILAAEGISRQCVCAQILQPMNSVHIILVKKIYIIYLIY